MARKAGAFFLECQQLTASLACVPLARSRVPACSLARLLAVSLSLWLSPSWQDLLYHPSASAKFVLAVATGYFWYDTFDMAFHRMYMNQPVVWLHHAVVLTPFTLALHSGTYAPILVAGLVVEWNTLLQHARRLFTIFDDKSSPGFIAVICALYAMFIPVRIVPHAWVVWQTWSQWNSFHVAWQAYVALVGSIGITVVDVGVLVVCLKSDWASLRGVCCPDRSSKRD